MRNFHFTVDDLDSNSPFSIKFRIDLVYFGCEMTQKRPISTENFEFSR